ncbi:MAG: putative penicillin-binding protein PbpX [Firmicutes bacterium ADurb.Bin193]|nr:MAG: putative penicillin-binding protein PbpX [Firmicutes bacterium ADurb.Bin193]
MRKLICAVFMSVCILTVTTPPVFALQNDSISEYLSGSVSKIVKQGKVKGVVVSVVRSGETRLCEGFGFADEWQGIKADGEKTAFRIGSVSKTFVAVAAQILNESGSLDMDKPISEYLETDFPKTKYPITMRQLLTHSAGFEDMISGNAVKNVSETEPLSQSIRKYLPAQVFKPGEVISYSNYGIALAAYVVERIAKQDFSQFCAEKIFIPLNMKKTTFSHMHDIVYVSKPYLPNGKETQEPFINIYPEGSAVSTAADMARYMQWLLTRDDERVLSARSKDELFKKQFSMADEMEGMGYVWNRKTRNGKYYYDKKGETPNFFTRIALYPEEEAGVFISFNTYYPEKEIDALLHKVTDILYGEQLQSDTGEASATINIGGIYTTNWSSFVTPEKILRYITPGKVIKIKGSLSEGFSINGERLVLTGKDLYLTPFGKLKFMNKEGKIIIATETAMSYSKIPFWQSTGIQVILSFIFPITALAYIVWSIILLIRKKRKIFRAIPFICEVAALAAFCLLCVFLYKGIERFNILSFALPLAICGWVIVAANAAGLVHTIRLKPNHSAEKYVLGFLYLVGIVFCLWLYWLNII